MKKLLLIFTLCVLAGCGDKEPSPTYNISIHEVSIYESGWGPYTFVWNEYPPDQYAEIEITVNGKPSTKAPEGAEVIITVTAIQPQYYPDTGYYFYQWNGPEVWEERTDNPLSFTMPNYNIKLTPAFCQPRHFPKN